MTVEEVLDRVKGYPCRLVELTGGEPLLQEEVYPLMGRLLEENYEVLIETSGSLDIRRLDPRVHIIMDIKCPGSGMSQWIRWENIQALTSRDEIKFVVRDRKDYEWAVGIVQRYNLAGRCPLLFSPVFGELEPHQLAQWILQDGLQARLQLQIHKYIWDPQIRGV